MEKNLEAQRGRMIANTPSRREVIQYLTPDLTGSKVQALLLIHHTASEFQCLKLKLKFKTTEGKASADSIARFALLRCLLRGFLLKDKAWGPHPDYFRHGSPPESKPCTCKFKSGSLQRDRSSVIY